MRAARGSEFATVSFSVCGVGTATPGRVARGGREDTQGCLEGAQALRSAPVCGRECGETLPSTTKAGAS